MDLWSLVLVFIKVALIVLGLSWLFGGPRFENGEIANRFHKFSDPHAAIFRVLGLVMVILSALWLFSDRAAIRADTTAQAVYGIGASFGIILSLVLVVVGRPAIGWFKMGEVINEELLPARIWGLVFLIGFVLLLLWMVM